MKTLNKEALKIVVENVFKHNLKADKLYVFQDGNCFSNIASAKNYSTELRRRKYRDEDVISPEFTEVARPEEGAAPAKKVAPAAKKAAPAAKKAAETMEHAPLANKTENKPPKANKNEKIA
jgi:hypothetical protein